MCSKDEETATPGGASQKPPPAAAARNSSSPKETDTDHAPSSARLSSSSRRRSAAGGVHAAQPFPHDTDSEDKYVRSPVMSASFFSRAAVKRILIVCISGVAWACLIVRILGPAVVTQKDSTLVGGSGSDVVHLSTSAGSFGMPTYPGWTPLGHHSKFLGQEAFPKQFAGWGEGEQEVVVNGVDVKPLDKALPTSDLVLAILSADTEVARGKRDTLRELYDSYEGWIKVGGKNSEGSNNEDLQLSFRVIFVVSNPSAPPDGEVVGDILYVNAPDGYRNIVHKVKHMMGLVRHISFKYLLKADDDTFVCVKRVADYLHDQPEEFKNKIYAGVPTACNLRSNPNRHVGEVIKNRQDKWYDQKFVHHSLSSLRCYPVYMQGAFYVLAHPLVEHLYRGRDHYETFVNEDVTIGSWLLGVDRTLGTIHDFKSSRLWDCACGGNFRLRESVRNGQVFFHNCKSTIDLRRCGNRLYSRPELAC